MVPGYALREATEADVPSLASLYAASVREAGPVHYTPEQVEAWAAFADDSSFRGFVVGATTFVAEGETGLLGFSGLDPDGRVASLYVRPDRMRQGIGAALLRRVLEEAEGRGLGRLWTEASVFSKPVFERHGFTVAEVERVQRRGAVFTRYRMVREEAARPNPPPGPAFSAP